MQYIWIFSILISISCGQATVPSTDKQPEVFELTERENLIAELLEKYQRMDFRLPAHRTQQIDMIEVLSRLHPQFTVGQLLKENAEFYMLQPIPASVQEDLRQLFVEQKLNYGIGYLSLSFWEDVFAAQRDFPELQIVFLKNNSRDGRRIGGYFNFMNLVLALSVTSDPGTVAHELQHYKQYKQLDTKTKNHYFGKRRMPCLSVISTIFAEMDATREQTQYWKGLYQSVDPSLWIDQLKEQQNIASQFNLSIIQNDIWNAGLSYVPNLLQSLQGQQNCPSTIQRSLEKLDKTIHSQRREIGAASRTWYIDLHRYINGVVLNNFESNKEIETVWNQKNNLFTDRFHKYLDQQEQDIIEVANVFAKSLAPSAFKDLCNKALGFRNLVKSCPKGSKVGGL